MKVYLAGRYGDLPLLRDVAYLLLMAGHQVTSRWLLGNSRESDLPAERSAASYRCWSDLNECEEFVLYNHAAPATRQGHSVELGMALGKRGEYAGSPNIVLVGDRTDNIFHWMPKIVHFANWYLYFEHLKVAGELVTLPRPIAQHATLTINGPRSIDAQTIQSRPN